MTWSRTTPSHYAQGIGAKQESRLLLIVSLVFALSLGFFSGKELDKKFAQTSQNTELNNQRASLALPKGETALNKNLESNQNIFTQSIFSSSLWIASSSVYSAEQVVPEDYLQSFYFRRSFEPKFDLKSIEGRFGLDKEQKFLDIGFGSDAQGSYVLRIMRDRLILLYAVLDEERVQIQEILLTQPIGAGPLNFSIDKNEIALRYYDRKVYGFSVNKLKQGKISLSTNLASKDIKSLVVISAVDGVEYKDYCA